jgi:hypothetical protein
MVFPGFAIDEIIMQETFVGLDVDEVVLIAEG